MEPKASWLGVASAAISVLAGLGLFAMIAVVGFLQVTTPGGIDETSPTTATLGLAVIGCAAVEFFALILGIASLLKERDWNEFAIVGTITSLLALLGTGGLIVVGTLAR